MKRIIYRCPDYQHPEYTADSVGCGHEFESEPDDEGIVDCPNCGMWFTPTKEPTPMEQLAQAAWAPDFRGTGSPPWPAAPPLYEQGLWPEE